MGDNITAYVVTTETTKTGPIERSKILFVVDANMSLDRVLSKARDFFNERGHDDPDWPDRVVGIEEFEHEAWTLR